MEDGEKSGASANAAKSLFRMDGSGYLSSGRISWDDTGSLYIDKNVVVGDNNETLNNLVQMLSDFYSWFEEVPIVIDGVNRKALHLKTGTDVGLAGLYADGFISAGGLSNGGGTAGADLPAVWTSLRNVNTTASEINSTIKIADAHIPDMASTYGYLKSADAVADVVLNGYYLRVMKNGANTDLIIPYATTARYVVGDNNAASPQYALLQSGGGRQDASPEGDTWLFYDTLGGADSPWGIRHNQGDNTIGFIGAGTERILLNMQTGAITGVSFVKSGGTSAQFLKADGSVDSSAYITGINSSMVTTAMGYTPANSASLANYVTLGTEQTITGRKFFTSPSSLVLQLSNNEVNNYTEGIRFNIGGANAWAGFTIGGTQVTGSGLGIWAFLVTNNDFYIGHNGSSNATYGLSWTSSGALNLKTSSLTSNGSTIWTAANDGAASGLDADLLDGQHGSYYAPVAYLNYYLSLAGGTLSANNHNILNIDSTHADGNNWIYFKVSGANKASVGYYLGLAFIANENTYSRIGVNDDGVPQYWNTSEGGSGHEFTIFHSGNLTKSVLTGLLDASGGYYLPLTGGEMSGQLTLKDFILKFSSGSTERFLGYYSDTDDLSWYTGSVWTKVWHSGNSNLSTVPWACSTLNVSSDATISGILRFGNLINNDDNIYHPDRYPIYLQGTGNGNVILAYGGGNVIIGSTTVTSYKLDVLGTGCFQAPSGSDALVLTKTSNYYPTIVFSGQTANATIEGGDNLLFYTNGSARLRILKNGNVGIGTTSPSQTLHVVGNIFSTGEVISNSVHSFRIIVGNYGSF